MKGNNYLQELHNARKLRLARMGGPKLLRIKGIDPKPFWPRFWMWGLVELGDKPLVKETPVEPVELPEQSDEHLDGSHVPTVNEIIRATAEHFKIPAPLMLSQRRTHKLCMPRQVAMYLCRELTYRTFPQIARRFGKRDHTTILHGAKKIATELRTDEKLASDVSILRAKLTFPGAK